VAHRLTCDEGLLFDLRYAEDRSFTLDLLILWKTGRLVKCVAVKGTAPAARRRPGIRQVVATDAPPLYGDRHLVR
jgi:hypothetical protein